MIIDYTYFFGKLRLPQLGNTEGREEVMQLVEQYETEFLRKVLGYDLWLAFTEGIEGSGTVEQRWVDLLEGIVFDFKGVNRVWIGFSPDSKITPIANYCYYRYLEDTASDVTLAGTATGAVDNNTRTSPMTKMVNAWNDMVDMLHPLNGYLHKNKTYPEYKIIQTGRELFGYKNSLDL